MRRSWNQHANQALGAAGSCHYSRAHGGPCSAWGLSRPGVRGGTVSLVPDPSWHRYLLPCLPAPSPPLCSRGAISRPGGARDGERRSICSPPAKPAVQKQRGWGAGDQDPSPPHPHPPRGPGGCVHPRAAAPASGRCAANTQVAPQGPEPSK